MNYNKEKVSSFQFFSMLYLTRVLTTVTFIPSYTSGLGGTDMIISTAFRFLFGLVVILPVYFLYKKSGDKGIIDIARERSPLLAKILAVFYAIAFLYFAASTVARLDVFAGTIIFPETSVRYLLIPVIIICCYGAYLGLQALSRSSVLSLFAIAAIFTVVTASLTKKVDYLNFSPAFYSGVSPVLKTALNSLGRTSEYIMAAAALPKVSGNKKRGYIIWLAAQSLTAALMFFLMTGVMGDFAETQLFPLHTLSSIAQFAVFEQLDAIITGVWILCAFLKISFLIYLAMTLLKKEFGEKNTAYYLVPIGVILIAANLFIARSIDRFMITDNSYLKLSVTLAASFVLPAVMLIVSGKKEEKPCEKQPLSS